VRTAVLIAILALGVSAGAARATTAPIVPPPAQATIAMRAGALAYVPTRIATGFHYQSWQFRTGLLRISFRNKAAWEITFTASPQSGSCAAGKEKSFQLDGNKVYWAHTATQQQAWRCVSGSNGRQVRLAAASPLPPTKFADVGLGIVAASGKRL
jgi:hypothetical protein